MSRYGTCYKGSKSQIAEWVYSHFPRKDNFYDLFAGGCSITHVALVRSEFKKYVCNDIDSDGIQLFLNAIYGKYKNESRWISREEFFRLKDSDPYVKYAWSFGNNGRDYLYSKEIEPLKKAWHFAIYFHDYSLAEKLGIDLKSIEQISGIYNRYIATKRITQYIIKDENKTRSAVCERQQQLEALNRLQSLQSLQSDYSAVSILPNSVIYCDIPYHNTNAYGPKNINNFDYERFYNWCERQVEPLFISEYWMPQDRFTCIDEIEKTVSISSGADKKAVEKLFIPKHQKYDKWHGTLFEGFFS